MVLAMVPVPKHSPLLHLVGLTFERGLRIHRVMGRVAVVAAVLHSAGYVVYWEQRGSRNCENVRQAYLNLHKNNCIELV